MNDEEKQPEKLTAGNKSLNQIESRKALQMLLLEGPEKLISDKGSDASLDRRNEIYKLISGREIDLREVRAVITSSLQAHPPQFYLEFYSELYRLLDITDKDPSSFIKPKIIADITNEIIYSRFDKDVLPTLKQINKYVGFNIRANRHYQYFNAAGIHQLQIYISDAISLMNESSNYYDFRKKVFSVYGIPYQIELFKENSL